jgi:hypothetical protein
MRRGQSQSIVLISFCAAARRLDRGALVQRGLEQALPPHAVDGRERNDKASHARLHRMEI